MLKGVIKKIEKYEMNKKKASNVKHTRKYRFKLYSIPWQKKTVTDTIQKEIIVWNKKVTKNPTQKYVSENYYKGSGYSEKI